MSNIHLSTEDVIQMTPNVFGNAEVKQENAEDFKDNLLKKDDHVKSSGAEDIIRLAVIKDEPSDVTSNDAAAEQDDTDLYHSALGLHMKWDVLLDIVKEEPGDIDTDTRDDRSTSLDSQNDVGTEYFIKPDPDVHSARLIFEEDDHVQSSDTEDIISVAVVKAEPSDVTGNDAAVEQDDADLYHSALGLHTECDIPLDIVKEEPDDVDTGAPRRPRLAAQKYRNDTLLSNLKRDKRDKPVKKNKIVGTRAKIDKKNNKQNYSTSDHSDVHKEKSGNKISAVQSVNSSSSNKLTPLLCDTCQKCFKHKCDLIRHIRIHTGEKPYECNVCKKRFNEKSQLNSHTRIHTGEKPHVCYVCKKCFRHKSNLDTHVRSHTGEKPYMCNVCKKCFHQKSTLNIHTRSHTGLKPYECNLCKKCFNQRGHLKSHMLIHTGEKPYECNVCKKCFNQRGSLNLHMRTHTGEKPHECNVCKKRFNEKSQLNSHTRIHTGEKPHVCYVCKKCFSHKNNLNKHVRSHTGE